MANQNTNNIVDSVVDAQKQMVDNVVENTKKFANGNNLVNETVQKGSEWYKNWLDNQTTFFKTFSGKAETATETVKENTSKMNDFYQNWMNSQLNWSKQMWDMSQDWFKNAANNVTNAAGTNPMTQWNNWMNNWNTWNQANNWANNWNGWMNQWQTSNPFNMDAWKKNTDTWTSIYTQYTETLNNSFAELQKNMQSGSVQDAYRNMVNVTEGFARFNQMWAPMWKSIQEKTFNMDFYNQWMNPVAYKEMLDKYFGFMPEGAREQMQQMSTMMQDNMKQFGQFSNNAYQQFRGMANNAPFNANDFFGGVMSNYNTWYNMLNDALSPVTKMMTPNQHTKTLQEWQDIANRMMVYNIKNAEMQYLIYAQGGKVMDELAQNILGKIEKGEDINSMMALYQEWMNISDKTYVSLFESDTYSQLMAEVSAMQMRLKKDMEAQAEKFLVGVPVATRSEMDELYKTIYELKKQVRELERLAVTNIEANTTEAGTTEEATTAKRSTKK
jgi:hypothetical protein